AVLARSTPGGLVPPHVLDAWANANGLRRQGRRACLALRDPVDRFDAVPSRRSGPGRLSVPDLALVHRGTDREPARRAARARATTIPPGCSWFSGRPPGRTAGWRSSGAISSKLGTTNISEGFPIMWPTAATRTFGNGEARRSTYARSIARWNARPSHRHCDFLRFRRDPRPHCQLFCRCEAATVTRLLELRI